MRPITVLDTSNVEPIGEVTDFTYEQVIEALGRPNQEDNTWAFQTSWGAVVMSSKTEDIENSDEWVISSDTQKAADFFTTFIDGNR